MNCPLCDIKTTLFYNSNKNEYFKCKNCLAICMHPSCFVSIEQEKNRYQQHNNDINDQRYQDFVQPIVQGILNNFNINDCGLDFGCGTGPVIIKLLSDKNYKITGYDPLFYNNPKVLNTNYNFIACCEVIEHFHNPLKEFKLLKSLLKPDGKLFCMTEIYNKNIDFDKWYYKNDDTHVIFYHKKTIAWIKENLGFSKVSIKNRLVIFEV